MDGIEDSSDRAPSVRGIVPGIGKHSGVRIHGLSSFPILGGSKANHNFDVHPKKGKGSRAGSLLFSLPVMSVPMTRGGYSVSPK